MQYGMHNSSREGYDYHSAPFPTPRTKFDAGIQQNFCPSCPYKSIENYTDNPSQYRTAFDLNMARVFNTSKDKDYSQAFYKSGYYDRSQPRYERFRRTRPSREGFADDGAYERAFTHAGFIQPPPTWVKEGYDSLYDDPDNPLSYGLFNR